MSVDVNKQLVHDFIEAFNKGNTQAIMQMLIPDSMLTGALPGQIMAMRTMMPDISFSLLEMIAEGDTVVAHVEQNGTNTGPMTGFPLFGRLEKPVPPSGNSATIRGVLMFRFHDGKIESFNPIFDLGGLLLQLGWKIQRPDEI